jgi:hypothetical protein
MANDLIPQRRTIFGINSTLLHHLAAGPYAALDLRLRSESLPSVVSRFLQTRTDVRRLAAAQEVAEVILRLHDHTEMILVRDIVAKQELRRTIKYGKQQDHTAHTVYLYLLGIWLYDNVPLIRSSIERYYFDDEPSQASTKAGAANQWFGLADWFLSQWSFASLLHDVGYVFHNLSDDTVADREHIDNLYSLETVLGQFRNDLSAAARDATAEAVGKWSAQFGQVMRGTSVCGEYDYPAVIAQLSLAPWLRDFDPRLSGRDIFNLLDPETLGLRDYAYEVASEGYGGKGRCVDHAVASGLLLFQYSSFWYWLVKYIRQNNSIDIYNEVTGNYDYDESFVTTGLASACHAVGFHNIQPQTKTAATIIPHITLKKDPITFLAILCDELQRWDRIPAGSILLDQYREVANKTIESDDVELSCWLGRSENNAARESPDFSALVKVRSDEVASSMRNNLKARLPGFREVVDIL